MAEKRSTSNLAKMLQRELGGLRERERAEARAEREKELEKIPDTPLKVRATRTGFYGKGERGARYRAGQVFIIASERHFVPSWMERVGPASADDTVGDVVDEQIEEEHDTLSALNKARNGKSGDSADGAKTLKQAGRDGDAVI